MAICGTCLSCHKRGSGAYRDILHEDEPRVLSDLTNCGQSISSEEEEPKKQGFLSRNRGGNSSSPPYMRKVVSQMDGYMCLSILKMDNTTFEIVVPKDATIWDLKDAVEKRFDKWKCGEEKVSWPHVWENFCLSYMGQMLVDENALLHQLGIREKDQLHFARHVEKENRRARRRRFFYGIKKKLHISCYAMEQLVEKNCGQQQW